MEENQLELSKFKYFVFGDIHIMSHPKWYYDQCKDILLNKIPKVLKYFGIETVIFLGDVFERKNHISNKERMLLEDFIDEIKNYEIIFILGNHDFSSKDENTCSFLKDKVLFVDNWYQRDNVLFASYKVNLLDFESEYLFCHHGINDLKPFRDVKIGLKDLHKKYGKIFSGHYHKRTIFNNFIYVGAPWQRDFRDCNYPSSVLLLSEDFRTKQWLSFDDHIVHHVQLKIDQLHQLYNLKLNDGWKYRLWLEIKNPDDEREIRDYINNKFGEMLMEEPIIDIQIIESNNGNFVYNQDQIDYDQLLNQILDLEEVNDKKEYFDIGKGIFDEVEKN